MQADRKDLETLFKLQEADLDLLRSKKSLDELPQKAMILALREKKGAIEKKQAQVAEMRKEAAQELARISDEDAQLAAKQDASQDKIASAKGDYRVVEALTKELSGIAKRRNSLESTMEPLREKLATIEQVFDQASAALDKLNRQEAEAIASYKKDGGALSSHIAGLTAARETALASLDAPLADLYTRKLQRHGGVAVTRLSGNLCTVCHNVLEEGRLLQAKGEAPLTECPYCQRLMVVVDD
ncbi:MAG: hypothetical protein FWD72_03945 [Eggerthellaceae bacterium]|nr:hypothetical protein [Eggerthellaceae bacterium]